ncbi:hypothetical protein TWF281_006323 [Arthrobotrys megalospora]
MRFYILVLLLVGVAMAAAIPIESDRSTLRVWERDVDQSDPTDIKFEETKEDLEKQLKEIMEKIKKDPKRIIDPSIMRQFKDMWGGDFGTHRDEMRGRIRDVVRECTLRFRMGTLTKSH